MVIVTLTSVRDSATKPTTRIVADELHRYEVEDVKGWRADSGNESHFVEIGVLDAHLVHRVDRLLEKENVV